MVLEQHNITLIIKTVRYCGALGSIFEFKYVLFIAITPIKVHEFIFRAQAMLCLFALPVLINNSELNSCCFFNAGYGGAYLRSLRLSLLTLNESSPSCSTRFYISPLCAPVMLQSQVSVPGMFQMSL